MFGTHQAPDQHTTESMQMPVLLEVSGYSCILAQWMLSFARYGSQFFLDHTLLYSFSHIFIGRVFENAAS
jgi:hypothetical protein